MPIYEYVCNQCHGEFSHLFFREEEKKRVRCAFCRSKDIRRLLSSFTLHQTEASRLADFDPAKPRGNEFYKDSRNIGLYAKKKMRQLGVDLGPQMDEIVERGRTGKNLENNPS